MGNSGALLPYVRTSTHSCKPLWNFAFQAHTRFDNKWRSHPGTFRDKKNNNNNKADSFFRLHFNVYIDLDNCEKELEWEIKNKGIRPISLEERHANFIAVVKKIKWEMLSVTKVKISDSEKKVNRNNYNIFSIMYNYDVSGRLRCGRAKQRQKKCLHVKVVSVFVY